MKYIYIYTYIYIYIHIIQVHKWITSRASILSDPHPSLSPSGCPKSGVSWLKFWLRLAMENEMENGGFTGFYGILTDTSLVRKLEFTPLKQILEHDILTTYWVRPVASAMVGDGARQKSPTKHWWYIYIYISVSIYIYKVYAYMHLCTYAHTCIRIYANMFIWIYVYMDICLYVYM